MERIYDPVHDKAWSSHIYQEAKEVIKELLSTQDKPIPFNDILKAVKQKYPALCDDDIRDPTYPKMPYWKHRVASAIQTLKKARQSIILGIV